MSEENVELVSQSMDALLRRDRASWLAIHDEDFEIVYVRDWPEVPCAVARRPGKPT
jgi:ketosteroid isomerase-like protein